MATIGLLQRIQMVDHLPVITPDLRIEPRTENAIDQEVKLFQIPLHFLVVFEGGNGDDLPFHAEKDLEIGFRISAESLGIGKKKDLY